MAENERSLAIFIDFENLALGFQGRRDRFDIARVLERLVEKGKIVAKKAYADWSRFSQFTFALHEAAIELIEIPRRAQSGKNSADIRLCVDAMDLAYSKEHINTFVILSGDSDFSPLVSKLKELGKHVIGLGMQQSTSDLLRDNCDEFIYYEDLGEEQSLAPTVTSHLPEQKRKAFELLMESLVALRRENKDVLWSSMIKDTMKRKKPSFNETYHGYRTFSELLEDAQREALLELDTDKRSRTYVVTRFGAEMHTDPAAEGAQPAPESQASPTPGSAGPSPGVPAGSGVAPQQGPDGFQPLPRKKSRRRRRRGGGAREGAAAGASNGTTGQPGGPVPVQDFEPVHIPPGPGATGGIVVVPSKVPVPPQEGSQTPQPDEEEVLPTPTIEAEPTPAETMSSPADLGTESAEIPETEEEESDAEPQPEPAPTKTKSTTRSGTRSRSRSKKPAQGKESTRSRRSTKSTKTTEEPDQGE